MVLTAGSMFQGYHTLVPDINSIIVLMVWVPLISELCFLVYYQNSLHLGLLAKLLIYWQNSLLLGLKYETTNRMHLYVHYFISE